MGGRRTRVFSSCGHLPGTYILHIQVQMTRDTVHTVHTTRPPLVSKWGILQEANKIPLKFGGICRLLAVLGKVLHRCHVNLQ